MSMVLVSVYITTYNRVFLLEKALKSVQMQTHTNLEIIVVDDNSGDDTQPFVEAKLQDDDRIVYLRNDKNSGACFSRNRAINTANGQYITGLDDDDEFTPDRIATFVNSFDPKYSFICSNYFFSKGGRSLTNQRTLEIDKTDILYENYALNQVFTLTSRLKEIGGFDNRLSACQDYDTWIRLIFKFGKAFKHPKATYVINEEVATTRITTSPKSFRGYLEVYNRYKSHMTKKQRAIRLIHIRERQNKSLMNPYFWVFARHAGLVKVLKFIVKSDFSGLYNLFLSIKTRRYVL